MTTSSEPSPNRILIIDDNPAIHADIRKILHSPDEENVELEQAKALLFGDKASLSPRVRFLIDSAYQGQEGLEMVIAAAKAGQPYSVAFVDIRMPPGWDGVETIGRLWESFPELQVVICTAYSDYSWEEMIEKLGHSPSLVVLKKPFDNIEVLQLAHALTDKWRLNRQVSSQLKNLDSLVLQRTAELENANQQLKREIAARIEAEGIMRLSEERFSKAFRASPIPFAIQSLETELLVDANEAFLVMLSGSRDEIVNRSPAALRMWTEAGFGGLLLEALKTQPSISNRACRVRSLKGQERQALLSIELFESGSGPHLLIILQDITEHLKLESELRQSQKMEAVGQLAAGVAHDFNNILTAIHGHASLLQVQLVDEPSYQRPLTVISLAAERASRLVRQLLTFSRKQILKPQPLNLDQVASSLADLLKRILGDHVVLELCAEPGLPAVKADASMMEQILLNLSVNARDAMPRGGKVQFDIRAVDIAPGTSSVDSEMKPGRYVRLSVSDNGCGIAPENLPRIFDPFFTTKEIGKGTGLGLATVYGIVKQHEGYISVESVVGTGTTFHILLPATTDPVLARGAVVTRPPESFSGSECLLVVEDEELVRSMTVSLLRGKGYRVLEAASGADALALFTAHQNDIQLLFTDIMMPGNMLGDELASRIWKISPSLPVLFTSGYMPDIAELQVRDELNFLSKPFTPSQMLEQIRRCLDRARAKEALAQKAQNI